MSYHGCDHRLPLPKAGVSGHHSRCTVIDCRLNLVNGTAADINLCLAALFI